MENKEKKNDNVESNTKNNIPEKKDTNMNADFSKIFNVASEEKEEANNKMELPTKKEVKLPEDAVMPKVNNSNKKEGKEENQAEKTSNPQLPKKKSAFNGEEKIIYQIQEEKESNPIVPLFVFIIMLVFIGVLPFISKQVFIQLGFWEVETPKEEEEVEPQFYFFNKSTVRAKIDNLEFTNFVKSYQKPDYKVSFTMTNAQDKTFQFNKKYYLVMYDNEDRVVYRALIHSFEAIGAMAAQGVDLIITKDAFDSGVKFRIEEIPPATYPTANMTEHDGEYEVMKCTYGNDEMKYYFLDKKLYKIKETYTELSNSGTFQTNKAIYKATSNRYKQVEGLESTFIETEKYFTLLNEFELKEIPDATISLLKTYRFFKYNEKPDIVSFELEAQGYSCS